MKNKLIVVISVVALALAGIAFYKTLGGSEDLAGAAPGTTLPIENYVPVVKYNGGIYSELPIQTTSDVTAATFLGPVTATATSTFADLTQTSAATTTHKILSTSSTQGGCVQVNATSTNTNIRLVFGAQATTTGVGTFNGEVFWVYGTCE